MTDFIHDLLYIIGRLIHASFCERKIISLLERLANLRMYLYLPVTLVLKCAIIGIIVTHHSFGGGNKTNGSYMGYRFQLGDFIIFK